MDQWKKHEEASRAAVSKDGDGQNETLIFSGGVEDGVEKRWE